MNNSQGTIPTVSDQGFFTYLMNITIYYLNYKLFTSCMAYMGKKQYPKYFEYRNVDSKPLRAAIPNTENKSIQNLAAQILEMKV